MKKTIDVLKVEHTQGFDGYYMVRIVYQDYEVLKRGEFGDNDLYVYSHSSPSFNESSNNFYIRGVDASYDNRVFTVDSNGLKRILNRVDKINNKYGKHISPEEVLDGYERVPFVKCKGNWYVYYNHHLNEYRGSFESTHETIGMKYISEEDACAFVEIFKGVKR